VGYRYPRGTGTLLTCGGSNPCARITLQPRTNRGPPRTLASSPRRDSNLQHPKPPVPVNHGNRRVSTTRASSPRSTEPRPLAPDKRPATAHTTEPRAPSPEAADRSFRLLWRPITLEPIAGLASGHQAEPGVPTATTARQHVSTVRRVHRNRRRCVGRGEAPVGDPVARCTDVHTRAKPLTPAARSPQPAVCADGRAHR
jgi:hypothetical protein